MALSADMVFEVRTTGSSSNPGGFKAGATGVDYSQQASAQASFTTAATVHTTTTMLNVPSGEHTVHANDVGNTIKINSGTATAGVYEITAVDTANNRWTVDRALGTAGQTAAGNMGGAGDLATVLGYETTNTKRPGQKIFIQVGTYQRSATTTCDFPTFNYFEQNSRRALRIIGYNATRGDQPTGTDRPVIQLITNTGLTGLSFTTASSSACVWLENIIVDGNSLGTSTGIAITGSQLWNVLYNCKVMNCTTAGIKCKGESMIVGCEATAISGGSGAIQMDAGDFILAYNYSHDNTVTGFHGNFKSALIYQNVSESNSGASSDGFFFNFGFQFMSNVAYNNGRDGLRFTTGILAYVMIQNNIFVSNGAYGVNPTTNTIPVIPFIFGWNAFYNNTTANINGWNSTAGSNGVGALATTNVTLTGNPFTDAANQDFTLNNTAGAGAACRAAGFHGAAVNGLPSNTGYLDIGAFQHQDAGGGGTTVIQRVFVIND